MDWDDLTHAISEIDDYVVGVGKGIASAFLDDGQLINNPNIKKPKINSGVSKLAEDWYNDSTKSKELTFNVLDTPVNYVLNTQSKTLIAKDLIKKDPQKYGGPNGWNKAVNDAHKLTFGKREGLAWYEQDPNRVQYGEAIELAKDPNAPIIKSFEQRQQYWGATDRLDDVMWTTLASMLMYDPLNFIPGGQAKNVNKVRNIQNIIDALDAAKTTDEAMEVVKGFNWQNRLPIPQDVKMIKKNLIEAQKAEIRNLVDEQELAQIQREVTLTLTQKPETLLRRGNPDYAAAVAQLASKFKFYEDLPSEIKTWLPKNNEFTYFNLGNDVWATNGTELFEWIPDVPVPFKFKKGSNWRTINVMPKHQVRFIKEISKEPFGGGYSELSNFSTFDEVSSFFDYVKYAAQPVTDSHLLNLPLYTSEGKKISSARGRLPLPDSPVPFQPLSAKLSLDPANTRFIEVSIDVGKDKPRKKVQLAITLDGVFHLDSYRPIINPAEKIPASLNTEADNILYKDIDPDISLTDQKDILLSNLESIKGSEKRIEIANSLFYRMNKIVELPEDVVKWIQRYSDPDITVDEVFNEIYAPNKIRQYETRYNPETNEFDEVDLADDDYLSDYFYKGLDDNSTFDFGDEFGSDDIENVAKYMFQIETPKVASTEPYVSGKRKLVWVKDDNFVWDKVKEYSLVYTNPITGKQSKAYIPFYYKVINPVEVSKGEMPKIIQTTTKTRGKVPSRLDPVSKKFPDTIYTLNIDNELVPISEIVKYQKLYEDNLQRAKLEVAQMQMSLGRLNKIDKMKTNLRKIRAKKNSEVSEVASEKSTLSLEELNKLKKDDPEKYQQEIQGVGNPVIKQQIADELRLEELKQKDPYAYQSYMERMYGVPRKVTFSFKMTPSADGSAEISFVRSIQEFNGYGDFQKTVGEPVDEVVHTWNISKQDLRAINNRMAETGGITSNSKFFKRAFMNEVTGSEEAAPIILDYKDLENFGEIRWGSTIPFYKPQQEMLDAEIVNAYEKIAKMRTILKGYEGNPMRAGSYETTQQALDYLLVLRNELIRYRNDIPARWTEIVNDSERFTGPKNIPATPNFAEHNFSRWLAALNYYGKTKVGLLDNLPVSTIELDAMRKQAVAKATEAMKAEERLADVAPNKELAEFKRPRNVIEIKSLEEGRVVKSSAGYQNVYVNFGDIKTDPEGIFVFGSNLAGRHGKGAALDAKNTYGAEYGVGKGLTGRSYALPTKGKNLEKLDLDEIKTYVDEFLDFAEQNPDKRFYVTSFGTGLAGNKIEDIAAMFDRVPENLIFTPEPNGASNKLGKKIRDILNSKKITDVKPTVDVTSLTRPEQILEEALRLNPGNKKVESLLKNFKSKQYGDAENDFLDSMLAAVSVDKNGNKLSEEDLTGFQTLLDSLTGDKDAINTINKQKDNFYRFVDESELQRQSANKLENDRWRSSVGENINETFDESQIPVIHSTKYPVTRNKDGSISLHPTGYHRVGTNESQAARSSLHFTLEAPVKSHMLGTWDSSEIKIVSDLSSMIKENKLPYHLRSDDTWWTRSPGKPLKILNASIIRPFKDVKEYKSELIKRGLVNKDENLPVIIVDSKTKDVLYTLKKEYTEEDRSQIIKLAREINLTGTEGENSISLFNTDSFIGRESEILEVLSLQLAKKELGINTPFARMYNHGLGFDLKNKINSIAAKYNLSSDIHMGSIPEFLEKNPGGVTKFGGGIDAMRYAALMGKFKANEFYGTIPGV